MIFLKKILCHFLFCQNSVSIWNWLRYVCHGCFAAIFATFIWAQLFSTYMKTTLGNMNLHISFQSSFPWASPENHLCCDSASSTWMTGSPWELIDKTDKLPAKWMEIFLWKGRKRPLISLPVRTHQPECDLIFSKDVYQHLFSWKYFNLL